MSDLSISNVINISVSAAPVGLGNYNTSNIGLFTREVPGNTFGTSGFKIYKSSSGVITDFGSSSVTSAMAISIFSQQPNLLAGSGYLVIMPMLTTGGSQIAVVATQQINFSGVAASGAFVLNYNGNSTVSIPFGSSAATIQTDLQALVGLATVTVSGSIASKQLVVTFTGVSGPALLLTVPTNTLADSGSNSITVSPVTATIGVVASSETIAAAITRTSTLVQYFGIVSAEVENSTSLLAAAAVVQSLNKIAILSSKTAADVAPSGLIDQLRTGSFSQTRGVLYVGTGLDVDAVNFAAAYAGRAFSTAFSGSNTTQTMHLKNLTGVQPDSGMTQTLLTQSQTSGADVYCSIQGLPKVFCSGSNQFFDQVYNLQWFVGALEIAGFNALATSSTKLPQTEQGIGVLKAAYRQVCEQAVSNQYSAPGIWTGVDTFGVLVDFINNISQRGYYIYSAPISAQSSADRTSRIAPLIQIALKQAGAVHSSNVLVFINA